MANYYSEWEPYAADWIRNMIKKGLIPDGEVDERSIIDVRPDDLRGFTQVHLFAGLAGWSLALRLAGWPDEKPIFSLSCPCQPFSTAGKRKGTEDERHLWPEALRLIDACQPPVAVGEQVDDAMDWLDGVHDDLDRIGYSLRAEDRPACSTGEVRRVGEVAGVEEILGFLAGAASGGAAGKSLIAATRERFKNSAGTGRNVEYLVGPPHLRNRLWWVAERRVPVGQADALQRSRQPGESRSGIGTVSESNGSLYAGEHVGQAHAQHSERGTEHKEHANTYGRDGSGGGSSNCSDRLSNAERTPGSTEHEQDSGERSENGAMPGDDCRSDVSMGESERKGLEGHPWDGDGGGEPGRIESGQDRSVTAAGGSNTGPVSDTISGGLEARRPLKSRSESREAFAGYGGGSNGDRGPAHGEGGGLGVCGEPSGSNGQPARSNSRGSGFWSDYAIVGPDPKGKFRRVGRRLQTLTEIEGSAFSDVRKLAHGVPERSTGLRTGEDAEKGEGEEVLNTSARQTPGVDSFRSRGGDRKDEMGLDQQARCHGGALAGWPSPDASVAQYGEGADTWLARRATLKEKHANGNGCGTPLAMAVQPEICGEPDTSGWISPTAEDGRRGNLPARPHDTGVPLSQQVVGWGTPRVTTNGGIPAPEVTGNGSRLEDQAYEAQPSARPTPTSLSFNESHQPGNSRNHNTMREVGLNTNHGDHIPLLEVGVPARVGKLKCFGNSIVPGLAAEVIRAYMKSVGM